MESKYQSDDGDDLRWIPHTTNVWCMASIYPASSGKVKCEIMHVGANAEHEVIIMDEKTLNESSSHVEGVHIQSEVSDMCQLFTVSTHEGPALNYVKNMFSKGAVYVEVSNLLVAVNPQVSPSTIAALYDKPNRFCVEDVTDLPPHIYKLCNKVIRTLFSRNLGNASPDTLNQSLIMHGDSGSGKTETAAYAMHWLVRASPIIGGDTVDSEAGKRAAELQDVLRDSNLVFAAFGCAKVKSNDNSSRFGKYTKLQFTDSNKLVSIYNETFLLEKSRLLQVTSGERNYHIFYQLFRGMGSAYPELKKRLNLQAVEQFKMLTNGNCLYRQHVQEDVAGFHASVKAMVNLGTTDEELKALWTLLAVMLHLGNAVVEQESPNGASKIVIDTMPFAEVAELLGVSLDVLNTAMTVTTLPLLSSPSKALGTSSVKPVVAQGAPAKRSLSKEEVQVNIHGFLKHIYKGIYFWLVRKTNHAGAYFGNRLGLPVKFLGVIDLYGFEDKGVNSLEQLCVNFAEERLKQQFTEHIFIQDANIYAGEGINADFVQYTDNQSVLDCINKKPNGILPSLDNCTTEKIDSVERFGQMIKDIISANDATASSPSKAGRAKSVLKLGDSSDVFVVTHFCGDVVYNMQDFLRKNVEGSSVDYTALLTNSTNTFLKATLGIGNMVSEGDVGYIPWLNNPLVLPQSISALKTKSIASNNNVTVSSLFMSQLETAMSNLRSTSSHYVKCIRPNRRCPQSGKGEFEAQVVNAQLRSQGIHEIITLTKTGFPERMEFREFYHHFERLKVATDWASPFECSDAEARQYASEIAANMLDATSFKVGRTLMFMRHGVTEFLENTILDLLNANAVLIQSHWKRYKSRKFYLVAVIAWRQKKATAEFAKSLFQDKKDMTAFRLSHNVQVDVFSAINTMQNKARRAASPSADSSVANIFMPIDADETSEDAAHIKRLQDYYLGKMDTIKCFIRNKIIQGRINNFFRAIDNGDQEAVMTALRRRPELLECLDKNNDFMSVRHAAVKVGNLEMLRIFGLTPLAVFLKDAGDNTCAHYAAIKPNLFMYRLFYKTISTLCALPKEQQNESLLASESNKAGLPSPPSSPVAAAKPSNKDSANVGKKSGYLFKLNNSGRLARRYCSLEKNRFKYWYTMPEKGSPDVNYHVDEFRVTRQECFVSRYTAAKKGELLFILNFSVPSTRKRRKSILWKANSETDLQSWLQAFSQVASFDRFRSYSPRFRNPNLCRLWLSQLTWARETALHTLVHAANSALRKSRRVALAENVHAEHDDASAILESLTCAVWLVEHGCPINQKNFEGKTALHLAVAGGNAPMALCLLRKGASLEVKDFEAKLPIDFCDKLTADALGFPVESHAAETSESDSAPAKDAKSKPKPPSDAVTIKVTEFGKALKQAMRQEIKEYFRLQMPNKEARLLPSPLTVNFGLRSPVASLGGSLTSAQKKGYSFISMHVQKHLVEPTEFMSPERLADLDNFKTVIRSGRACLQIGLYNASTNQLVEPLQECEKTIYSNLNDASIWWGFTYFAQTPLEFFPELAYFQFRLYLKDVDRSATNVLVKPIKPAQDSEKGEAEEENKGSEQEQVKMPTSRLVDIEISQASYLIDKSLIDSGAIRLNLRDVKGDIQNFGLQTSSEADADEKDPNPVKRGSLRGFKRGASQSTLELEVELSEYFEPMTAKDVLTRNTDSVQNYAPGCFVNNPQHLWGAAHDKLQNKAKRGFVKQTPVLFSTSYFEGAASERFSATLPKYIKAGDVLKNVGGLKQIDVCVPGHVRGGQSVVVVIPSYSKPANIVGLPEVKVDDLNSNRTDVVHLKYMLPHGVRAGPFVVQNTDGSRRLQFQVSEALIASFDSIDEKAPGLPIIITFNSTMMSVIRTHSNSKTQQDAGAGKMSSLFGRSQGAENDLDSDESDNSDDSDSSVDMYDTYREERPSGVNPMRSK